MSKKRKFTAANCIMTFFKNISVEPTMWLYMMAYMITSVIEQAFFIDKSCYVNHGYPTEVCSNLSQNTTIQAEIQRTVSEFLQWNNIAGHVVPIVLAMFIGNWSDRYGRKLPLIIGLLGKFIYSFMLVINSVMNKWNLNMIVYTASIPMGLLGGDISIFASCFAYISDITSVQERTLRVTLLDVVYLSAMPIGVAIGSFLYNHVVNRSYVIMFSINTCMIFMAIIYSLWNLEWKTTSKQISVTWKSIFSDFFDKQHVIGTFNTLFKKRKFYGRLCLWLVLFSMILYTFQRDEKPMSYMYTQLKFNWGITEFSNFRTFYSALFVSAMIITVPVMNRYLLLEDIIIVIIGAISHATGRILFALANNWETFYLGAVAAALGPIAAPALRSIASKIVPSEERGKVFSVLSVCDNAVPMLSSVLYSQVYIATMETSPNQIFWLTFASQSLVFLLMLIIHNLKSFKQLIYS